MRSIHYNISKVTRVNCGGVLRSTVVSGKESATYSPHTGKYVMNFYDSKLMISRYKVSRVENFVRMFHECFAGIGTFTKAHDKS